MLQGNRERSKGKASSISRMDRGSDRRGGREGSGQGRGDVSQFSMNGAGNQLLVGLLKGILVTNGSKTESVELLRTIGKTHKIRCNVGMICHQELL